VTGDMTADEGTANALPDVPPDWVALSDLPGCVARWYGVSMTVVAPAVVDAVWTGELCPWHRIAGIKPDGRWRGLPDGLTHTGVLPIHDPRPDAPFEGRIVAYDWAAADTDRRKGTVGGWPQKSGVRERLLIELPWVAVKDWAGPRVNRWKQEASEDRAAADRDMSGTPPPSVTTVAGTVLAEKQMAEWLTRLMQREPSTPTRKKDALAAALKDGMREISERAFLRAWAAAVRHSGAHKWSVGGSRGEPRT
jgi:hypothetical protein